MSLIFKLPILVVIALISFNNLLIKVQGKLSNGKNDETKSWSVELSSVTTLPPPSKMLAVISSSLNNEHSPSLDQQQQHPKHKPINQDNLFDDAPPLSSSDLSTTFARPYDQLNQKGSAGQSASSYFLTGPLDGHPPTSNSLEGQAGDLNKWTPTNHYATTNKATGASRPESAAFYTVESPTRLVDDIQPPVDYRPISSATVGIWPQLTNSQVSTVAPRTHHITQDSIARHFKTQLPLARQSQVQLSGETLVSQLDLLRRALAIRDALRHQQQPLTQSGDFGGEDRGLRGSKHIVSKRKIQQSKSRSWSSNDQDQRQRHQLLIWPASREDDLMAGEHSSDTHEQLAAPHLAIEPPSDPIARNYHYQALSALETGQRNSKIDYDASASQQPYQDKLLPSASHYRYHHHSMAAPTVYLASAYPLAPMAYHATMPHINKGVMRHDKASLLKPVLIGILAALVSFLIISNLFLSIPLFAMTLFQLISGAANMMMLPNGNMMPTPNNQQQQQPPNMQPNNLQMASGRRKRRRRRRDVWPTQLTQHGDAKSTIALEAIMNHKFG